MPLVFDDPDVLPFSAVNERESWRTGTFIVRLNEEAGRELAFHWEAPSRAPHGHSIAMHLPAPLTIERRASSERARSQAPQAVHTRSEAGSLVLPEMSSPGFDRIVVGEGAHRQEYEVWYVRGAFTIRTSGAHSPDNTKFEHVTLLIHDSRTPLPLGPGAERTTHHILDANSRMELDALDAWRYFGLVEFVGQIHPHDAPGGYRFLRRKTHRIRVFSHPPAVAGRLGRTAPMVIASSEDEQDTSNGTVSTWVPNANGRVFDTDGPGNLLTSTQSTGHTEDFSAKFVQDLVIGDRVESNGDSSESRLLGRKFWRFHATYRVVEAYSEAHSRPRIEEYPGTRATLAEVPASSADAPLDELE